MAAAAGLTGRAPLAAGRWVRNWSRLNGSERIAGVDLARGLAVIGMLAAHLLWIQDMDPGEPATWIGVVEGRSSILFATLAGVSIGLVTGGERLLPPPELRVARRRLIVRAGMLWVLGTWLIATGVPVFVILPAYAILFLVAVPLVELGTRALFVLAALLGAGMPFVVALVDGLPVWLSPAGRVVSVAVGWHYPFPVWIAFVLAGLGVARAGIRRRRVQWLLLAFGGGLAVVGYGLAAWTAAVAASAGSPYLEAVWTAAPHSSGLLEVIGSGGFALAVIGLCLLACRTPLMWPALPLRAVGAMPLSAYTAQLLVWAIAAVVLLGETTDLGAFRDLQPFWPMTVGIVLACTAWALLIGRGPLEWAVDRVARLLVRRR